MSEKKSLKGYYLTTFLIGFGFFTMGLMDPLYDTYVPIFLGKYIKYESLVGLIMTLDNILAIFLIPIFSTWSDRVDTKIGRRMPFIVTLLPLTAFAFGLIPFAALNSLFALIAAIFLLNIFKQASRGPVVALMPDMVPGDLRSEANGVINTMGGIATILGTVLLAQLMNVKIHGQNNILAFPVASLFVIVATIILFTCVKEKNSTVDKGSIEKEEKEPILKSLKAVVGEENKSALRILLSLFCWFIGYQGVVPFVGKYSVVELGVSTGTAGLAAGMVGIAYAIFAIPSGKVAHKFGRKKTIRTCLLALIIILSFVFAQSFLLKGAPQLVRLGVFWACLFCFGIFWVSVVTNSFPMLWQMSTYKTVGIYTGLYYFFSQLASIVAPPISGACIDLFGYPALFLFAAFFMLLAFIIMRGVDKGEPEDLKK